MRNAINWQSLVVLTFLSAWFFIWLSQTLYESSPPEQTHPRWHLIFAVFFLPDEVFSGWIDGRVSIQGIFDRLQIAMIVGLVAVPGWLLGYQLLSKSGIRQHVSVVDIVMLGLALGMSLHATATLLLGVAGLVSHRFTMPLLAITQITVAAQLGLLQTIKAFDITAAVQRVRDSLKAHGLPAALLLVGMLLVGARCLIPAHEFDVLEYHLGAPKEWYQTGRIGFVAHNIYANMPMAAEMQSLSAMSWAGSLGIVDAWWWGGLAGKSMMFVYWTLAIGMTGRIACRFVRGDVAWWLVAVAASGLAMAEVTVLGLIEAAVACYFAAALLTLAALRGSLASRPIAMLWMGLFAGSAFACKYPALLFVCVPVGLLASLQLVRLRSIDKTGARALGLFVLGCLITAGPWLLKNASLAGNPVYPLAAAYLGGSGLSEQKISQWQAAHAVPTRSIQSLVESLGRIAWSWKSQGCLILPLALIGVLSARRSQVVRLAIVIVVYTLGVWWLFTHHLERFLLPSTPVVMILAAFGIRSLFQCLAGPVAVAVLTLGTAMNLVLIAVSPIMGDPRLLVDTSFIRREAIDASESPRIAQHVLWANRNLQTPGELLLLVGTAAIYDYEVPVLYSTCFDESPLAQIASYPPQRWSAQFKQRGITHVLVHWGEIQRYRSAGNYGFDMRITRKLVHEMVERGILAPIDSGFDSQRLQLLRVQ